MVKNQRVRAGKGNDVLSWARANVRIASRTRGLVPFVPYPYQERIAAHYNAPTRLWTAARQVGKSLWISIESIYCAITEPNTTVLFVSKGQEEASNLIRYCSQIYASLPERMKLQGDAKMTMEFANGSRIVSLPATRSAGVSFTASRVYFDEFAFSGYANEIFANISPTLSRGGSFTGISAPNGASGKFYEMMHDESIVNRFVTPWHECPDYYTHEERAAGVSKEDCTWYKSERKKYTAREWAQNYECSFVTSGGGVFTGLDAVSDAPTQESIESGHEYVVGVDWGRTNDATVIVVWDVTANAEAALYRLVDTNYELQKKILAQVMQRFSVMSGIVEVNSMGQPLFESLRREGLPLYPFTTTNATKSQLIDMLVLAVENRQIRFTSDPIARAEMENYEDTKTATGLVTYSAPKGGHDDCVMARALAHLAGARRTRDTQFSGAVFV